MLSVEELIKQHPQATVEERNKLSQAWIEHYMLVIGKKPKPCQLTALADWILSDHLKDVSRSKVQNTEFPVLSKPQIERRQREISFESQLVDVLHQKKLNHQPTKRKDSQNNQY